MKHYLQTRDNNNYDLFDVFDDFFKPMFFDESKDLKTDIKETEDSYELDRQTERVVPSITEYELK